LGIGSQNIFSITESYMKNSQIFKNMVFKYQKLKIPKTDFELGTALLEIKIGVAILGDAPCL